MKNINLSIFLILYVTKINLSAQNDTLIVYGLSSNPQEGIDTKNDTPQQNPSDYIWKPCISPFIEFGGKGWLSLNVDFRIKETYAISIGVAGIEEGVSPNVMGYYFGGKRHRLEVGGGGSGIIADGSFISMVVNGVIGYRYQKKKGLLFRAGFTPMFSIPFTDEGKYAFIPWVGLSVGYSFLMTTGNEAPLQRAKNQESRVKTKE